MAQNPIKKGEQTKIVTVRMAESDYKSVQMRAEAASMTIAEYIRLLVLDAERLRDYVSDAKSLSLSLTDYVSDAKTVSDKIQKVMASMETEDEDENEEVGFEGLGSLFG
tara:strand:- start:671 stop:997 length:327 start_codon:yes stop_codon:yes gene_type:complete